MAMTFKTPEEKNRIDDDATPIGAIKKMNDMIKALTNKLPYKIGPWKNIEIWKSIYHPDPTDSITRRH